MIEGSRKLPAQHLSVRVPWHDGGWRGQVCNKPAKNTACRILKGIAEKKSDEKEAAVAGRSFSALETCQLPPCVVENVGFMMPFSLMEVKSHPYIDTSRTTHGHFGRTQYTMKPYSASCTPYRWMLLEEAKDLVAMYDLGFQPDREPKLPFKNNWVQERKNQLVMLDTFFSAVRPAESLCFFYAKDTPLQSSAARVIVGVGLVTAVDDHVEHEYTCSKAAAPFRGVLWERNVSHSIRGPKFEKGLLFPYAELFEAAQNKGFDPDEYLAFAPDDAFWSFSYGSEHVSHDHAIASVLSCIRALAKIEKVLPGPWRRASEWLGQQLARLWRMRGPFPGFAAAVTAFLGEGGGVGAYEIARRSADEGEEDPWPTFERVVASEEAEGTTEGLIGKGFRSAWLAMTPERKELLQLLSRFSISPDQAKRFFNPDHRKADIDEATLIDNPYTLFELDRNSPDPISLTAIDRGLLPDRRVAESHPLPERSRLADKVDPRRVRALMVAALEQASEQGHTLLPRAWLTTSIGEMALDTDCPTGPEVFAAVGSQLDGVICVVKTATGEPAYQLHRLSEAGSLIRNTIHKRTGEKSRRHSGEYNYASIVGEGLGAIGIDSADSDVEVLARREKAAALKELFESRLTALIGRAGTGKTTLLKMLCALPEVSNGGVLLLAPTGKARVQLETKTGIGGAMTIAQFLMRYGRRYEAETQRYVVTGSSDRCGDYKTVIVDECSMLTEEQLAALLDGISGVHRLVLVGDPRQLPPIGSGRPFMDIVRELEPKNIENAFPRVGRGYAELITERRQRQRGDEPRADLMLARWFGGVTDPGSDEIWNRIESETMAEVRLESWKDGEDPSEKLLDLIVDELKLDGRDQEIGFEESIGGSEYNGRTYFWRTKGDEKPKAESWQVIAPVRGADHGVASLNRVIQQAFRKNWYREASRLRYNRKVHPPLGPQGIVYGDKVINVRNSSKRRVHPKRESYVANGDVGLVVGSFKGRNQKKLFPFLEIEFTSQPNHAYSFPVWEFSGDEASPPLELAYALTVHKTQGSEFGTTFLVLPNPCWLLSRELLYTALTRQRDRVVILHKGEVRDLRRYASERYSDAARRLTNVFVPPNPVPFDVDGKELFLEEGLIHRTKRGDLVRSKSEVIIANELLAQGINWYEYEAPLSLNGKTRYPDFTIIDDDTGDSFYWEHLGMLNHPDYRNRWERKLEDYRRSGILPHEEGGGNAGTLIVTQDDERGGIDAEAIAELIQDQFVC